MPNCSKVVGRPILQVVDFDDEAQLIRDTRKNRKSVLFFAQYHNNKVLHKHMEKIINIIKIIIKIIKNRVNDFQNN